VGPLFALEEVTVAGAQRPRLDRVSLALGDEDGGAEGVGRAGRAGGITVLQGPSGSGKSTLLRLLNRLVAPDAGTVRYRGADLAARDVLAHRREVGMVFQAPVLFPGSVADNLAVAEPLDDPAALLDRVGLPDAFLTREAATLSGGEAQRACLARALATRPRVLLMDEPTSALDAEATAVIEDLTRRLADDGVSVVLVTHARDQAARLGDRVIALREGRLAA
jgi:putative ABC transport system ATP-binding protein